jgi:DNA-binding response OmpR family regulator
MLDPTILVIDDDPDIVGITTAVLRQAGFTTFGTSDPDEAIRLVETDPSIKLVLSDLSMPKLTGPEVVRRALRSRESDVRVLFMSGRFEGISFRQTDRLLEKPLSFESLATEIRSALTEARASTSWKGLERRRQRSA